MKTLLFLTPELPYPAQSGGKLKSLKLLEHLASRFDVTLCCPLKLDDAKHLKAFQREMPHVECITDPVKVRRSAINLLRSYATSVPLNVLRTHSPLLEDAVAQMADEFDVIMLDHYEVAQYVPESYVGKVIYHGHNAYFQLWERYSKTSNNPFYKIATKLEALRVKSYETEVARRADLVFAAPGDIDALRRAGVRRQNYAETYHLGDDSQLSLPDPNWYQTDLKLVYVGFLGWEANTRGLLWFIKNVWPQLAKKHPELKFEVVGKNPDERLQKAVENEPNIKLLGYVDDLETIYQTAHVCVAPLTFGSGMKVKVLNAMARGIPVVTTPVGAESIAAFHRCHLMVSQTASAMVRDIDELIRNNELWVTLAVNSRELIRDKYTWRALFKAMDVAIDDVLVSDERAESAASEAAFA
ncbi:glycosyltransferase family 4 protein [Pseudomonadales bacterium]|nr:glycosyltransferase family 4 protein [Pseudomonadales bacterium]